MAEPVSRGRGLVNEITHIAPIRAGYVPLHERSPLAGPLTYADRLKTILEASHKREDQGFPNVIRMFRGIHFAKWALIDGDTRLMLNVEFDGNWYEYLHALAYEVPAFLHLIWSNCEGWERVDQKPELLFRFIKAYQVRASFFYAHNPDLTVRDIAWLSQLRTAVDGTLSAAVRGKLHEEIGKSLGPKTLEQVRSELLREEQPRIERTRAAFMAVIGHLYSEDDASRAEAEAFGPSSPAAFVPAPTPSERSAERDAVQSSILRGYPATTIARMYRLHFREPDKARAWLRDQVSFGDEARLGGTQVAFTFEGVRALARDPALLLDFPEPFRMGMSRRRKQLGDPEQALVEDPDQVLHAILTVYLPVTPEGPLRDALMEAGAWTRSEGASDREPLRALRTALSQKWSELRVDGVEVLGQEDLHRPLQPDPTSSEVHGLEYFGFREGVRDPTRERDDAWLEFTSDSDNPVLRNGSFLAVRKLRQDVEKFWRQMRSAGQPAGIPALRVAESAMGIERDGDALARCPFSHGDRASAQSHLRRVNPHPEIGTARNPRMIRRGMAYVDEQDRCGLMFMAYVSDLERQFEFIQRSWVQSGTHVGATSRDHDPIAGFGPGPGGPSSFQGWANDRHFSASFDAVVELVWGGYFFAPSRVGLSYLLGDVALRSPQGASASAAYALAQPTHPIAVALASSAGDVHGQHALIRGWLDDAAAASSFWAYVESIGGLRVPFPRPPDPSQPAHEETEAHGAAEPPASARHVVFVADPDETHLVMSDEGALYSVAAYDERMRPTTGAFLLGWDARSEPYRRERGVTAVIPSDTVDIIRVSGAATQTWLREVWARRTRISLPPDPPRFRFAELLATVLDRLIARYFGLPGPGSASFVQWGGEITRYHFRALAEASDAARARQVSIAYRAHVDRLIAEVRRDAGGERWARDDLEVREQKQLAKVLGTLEQALGPDATDDDLARNLVGIVTGSLGATVRMFTSGLLAYASLYGREGTVRLPAPSTSASALGLYREVVERSLVEVRRGGPDSLFRRYVGEQTRYCDASRRTPIEPDDLVVAWLGGALSRKGGVAPRDGEQVCPAADMLFGAGKHACPGKDMSKALIEGTLRALSAQGPLKIYLEDGDAYVELSRDVAERLLASERRGGSPPEDRPELPTSA